MPEADALLEGTLLSVEEVLSVDTVLEVDAVLSVDAVLEVDAMLSVGVVLVVAVLVGVVKVGLPDEADGKENNTSATSRYIICSNRSTMITHLNEKKIM